MRDQPTPAYAGWLHSFITCKKGSCQLDTKKLKILPVFINKSCTAKNALPRLYAFFLSNRGTCQHNA